MAAGLFWGANIQKVFRLDTIPHAHILSLEKLDKVSIRHSQVLENLPQDVAMNLLIWTQKFSPNTDYEASKA